MTTEIPGYIYLGDTGSVADHGGMWLGVSRDNLGHIIEVTGAGDLEDGLAMIESRQAHVRGHVEMRRAMDSAGWRYDHTLGPADRDLRRAFLLSAYVGYYGADPVADYTGSYCERVDPDAPDADQQVIDIANRWAR